MRSGKEITILSASLLLVVLASRSVATAPTTLPNPILAFRGQEFYEANGKLWTRYHYAVENANEYPDELFAGAPNLPACGANKRAARTWVDVYTTSGKYHTLTALAVGFAAAALSFATSSSWSAQ